MHHLINERNAHKNRPYFQIKQTNQIIFFNWSLFSENHHATRHIKYKVIDFAPTNKSIMTNNLP